MGFWVLFQLEQYTVQNMKEKGFRRYFAKHRHFSAHATNEIQFGVALRERLAAVLSCQSFEGRRGGAGER